MFTGPTTRPVYQAQADGPEAGGSGGMEPLPHRLRQARGILDNFVSLSGPAGIVHRCVESVGSGQAVTATAWAAARIDVLALDPGLRQRRLLEVIDLFHEVGDSEQVAQEFVINPDGLAQPFVDCLELCRAQAAYLVRLRGLTLGDNDLTDESFIKAMLGQDAIEFRERLVAFRAGLRITGPDMQALSDLVANRATMEDTMINYLDLDQADYELRTEEAQKRVMACLLNADFCIQLYNYTLANPNLPAQFVDHFEGPQAVVPCFRLRALTEVSVHFRHLELNSHHLRFLELIRDSGQLFAGGGLQSRFKGVGASVSFNPEHQRRVIAGRNEGFAEMRESLRASGYFQEPAGRNLDAIAKEFIAVGRVFFRMLDVASPSELPTLNQQHNVHTNQIHSLMAQPVCPSYIAMFLRLCCINKAPRVANPTETAEFLKRGPDRSGK